MIEPIRPSDDSLALILLCSTVAAPKASQPLFSSHEWGTLQRQLAPGGVKTPAELFTADLNALGRDLRLPQAVIDRLKTRLEPRAAALEELAGLAERGIWVLTRVDPGYPSAALERLGSRMPQVLFGAGDAGRLRSEGLAIVGSRDVDPAGAAYADRLGHLCAEVGLTVISGGARGVDLCAMNAALEAGGPVLGVLADRLDSAVARRPPEHEDRLTLITCVHPAVGFSRGVALQRNRVIHALGRYTLVVASAEGGGTWSGSLENLERGWSPVLVRSGAEVPAGNRELLRRGAYPLPEHAPGSPAELIDCLHAARAA
jgi:predicted Rossmann fold nucleotide-binding protein DprA/Smf involved in DNA uptake